MREVVENLVIGGGPAGTSAAIQLAKAGKQVTLLERKPEAHDKVCGEFISWEAAHYLAALGIDLPALGAEPITNLRLVHGDDVVEAGLPFMAWSLSRRRLDAALLRCAELSGASVHCGATVKQLRRKGHCWEASIQIANSSNGARSGVQAGNVFLATGKYDLRDWRRQRPRSAGDRIGFKVHLHLAPSQRSLIHGNVELHFFDQGYAGIEPVEDGKVNLCFLISRDVFHRCHKHWPALLEWIQQSSSHMRERLAGAVQVWTQPLAVYGTPYGYLHSPDTEASGLYRLGDQMAVIPSLAGDGIAIALHSGFLAAKLHDKTDAEDYHRKARQHFRGPVRSARFIADLLSFATGRRLALWLASHRPELITGAVQGVRLRHLDRLASSKVARSF